MDVKSGYFLVTDVANPLHHFISNEIALGIPIRFTMQFVDVTGETEILIFLR